MVDSSINYYNINAKEFYDNTVNADMSNHYETFIKHLPRGGRILDAGCGSGRDSLFFKQKGYQIEAMDASEAMTRMSSELIGQKVHCLDFNDVDFDCTFDGIWACASLLHVVRGELPGVMKHLASHLIPGGIFYASFKYGTEDYAKNGRHFTCFIEDTFKEFMEQVRELKIEKLYKSVDARKERADEFWLNVLMKKF